MKSPGFDRCCVRQRVTARVVDTGSIALHPPVWHRCQPPRRLARQFAARVGEEAQFWLTAHCSPSGTFAVCSTQFAPIKLEGCGTA